MWSGPRNSMSVVFSAWSVPRLYNRSVFAAEIRLLEGTKARMALDLVNCDD
jgi:hypothetical protein